MQLVFATSSTNVWCWHLADMLNALTNVRFLGAKRAEKASRRKPAQGLEAPT
jgi:hypothetical protein